MITRHALTIPHSGRKVHYRRCGSGPALLIVHQSPRSSAEYERLMQAWGAHFTCIAPDTPGFGQSDPLPGTDEREPEVVDFAAAIPEFLDALGLSRCAAYGFHSGGMILMSLMAREPHRFSALAIGGYAVWTAAETRIFGESYLPPFRPAPYGEHLTWLWNRMLEQSWFFPWFAVADNARLPGAHADVERVNKAVMEMLESGDAYRAGYGAVLRAPRDLPDPDASVPPALITAYDGDPLQAHIPRLGELPKGWRAHGVATLADHEAESLALLREHAEAAPAPPLAEDSGEGWLRLDHGLVHWCGTRGAERLVLHAPGAELAEPGPGEVAIDLPGHGLSDPLDGDTETWAATIEAARRELGAATVAWPEPPAGDPAHLYPDLTPDRFGAHLLRAWGTARAEALYQPWYAADRAHAVPIDQAALAPEAIARRARARLRAGPAARAWHDALTRIADRREGEGS